MSALVIGDRERRRIQVAIRRARTRPLALDEVMRMATPNQASGLVTLADRPAELRRPSSEHVALPRNYHLAVSFEYQPPGLCLHLSISVDRAGYLPHPAAGQAIVDTCLDTLKIDRSAPPARSWIEDFLIDDKPGGRAVNFVFLVTPTEVMGHA